MMIQITIKEDEKSIRVDEVISLGELIEKLEVLLPNGAWKGFKLEPTLLREWKDPWIIPMPYPTYPSPIPVVPVNPWQNPWIVTCADQVNLAPMLVAGTYNVVV
jgi:hypothetical protein